VTVRARRSASSARITTGPDVGSTMSSGRSRCSCPIAAARDQRMLAWPLRIPQ